MYLPLAFAAGMTADDTIAPVLTSIERQVVLLALRDDRDSVCRGRALHRWLERLFGIRRGNPLADPRLEALRRFCVGRRLGCGEAAIAEVVADCLRAGLTHETLCAAELLSDLASPTSR